LPLAAIIFIFIILLIIDDIFITIFDAISLLRWLRYFRHY
jgi:hypothetical protein